MRKRIIFRIYLTWWSLWLTRHQITNDNQCHNRWHLSTQFSMKLESNIRIRQDLRLLILTRSGHTRPDQLVKVEDIHYPVWSWQDPHHSATSNSTSPCGWTGRGGGGGGDCFKYRTKMAQCDVPLVCLFLATNPAWR